MWILLHCVVSSFHDFHFFEVPFFLSFFIFIFPYVLFPVSLLKNSSNVYPSCKNMYECLYVVVVFVVVIPSYIIKYLIQETIFAKREEREKKNRKINVLSGEYCANAYKRI